MTALLLLPGMRVAAETSMQERSYDVNISQQGATVRTFTQAFTQQTGVLFSYESALAGVSLGNVTLRGSAPLARHLSQAFAGKDISWNIVNQTVVLTQDTAAARSEKRPNVVRGRVTDASGEALPGAGVLVKGTKSGTVTDYDGRYSIAVEPGQTLVFSFIGYMTEEVRVGRGAVADVVLSVDENLLDDVVVIGYGTQSRKTLTAAISKVDGDKLMDAPVTTVGDALKGKVTGLRVTSNNNISGEAPRFLIRGGSSINQSQDALCLVDGMQRDISDLNPNDIESIEVFKDAASTAIYGARASNGVILITTKKGNAFKAPQIVFDSQVGIIGPSRTWDMANATEFLSIVRPAILMGPNADGVLRDASGPGTGNTTSTATYSTRFLEDGEEVPAGYLSMPDPANPNRTIIYTDRNWQKDWFRTVMYQKHYVGINGGNKEMKYAASVGYVNDAGMLPTNSFENLTFHGNTSFKVTKNLEAYTTFDFSHATQIPTTDDFFAAIGRGLMMSPTHIGKYPDGVFATGGTNKNQQTAEFYSVFYKRQRITNRFQGSFGLRWNIFDWLTANAQYALFDNSYRGHYYAYGERNGTSNYIGTTRSTSETWTETTRQSFHAYLNADKSFGRHRITGTAGYEWSKWPYWYLNASNTGSLSDKIPYLQSGSDNLAGTMKMSNQFYETALISYFGRLQYNFADRYILAGSARYDGSSLFSASHKWGFFPSVSAAWLISEEPFFKSVRGNVNLFKLRVSYGQTGNNSISREDPLGTYAIGSYAGYSTLLPSVMMNDGLQWETTTQLDAGFDLGMYNDRIRLSFDYYDKVTSGLIDTVTLPDVAQLTSVKANVGSVRFYGAEVELHTVNFNTRDFRWETDLTYSYNQNRVLSLADEYKYEIIDMFGNPTGEYGYRIGGAVTESGYRFGGTAVGEPLGRIWGYKVAGILQTEEQAAAAYYDSQSHGYRRSDGVSIAGRKDVGDFEFVNRYGTALTTDGKEQIDGTDVFLLGNVMPHSIGGINNTFVWKRFTLSVYMDYAIGHSIYNYMKTRMLQNTLGNSNANIDVTLFNQTWRKPGDSATVARFFPNDPDFGNRNYSRASDFNVERADYLCLRDVSLYYDLPEAVAKWFHMKRFTVGVTGNTLHYFTRVSGAISPETGMATGSSDSMYSSTNNANSNGNLVPSTRKVLFNVKLTF
ncbi:MAG: TonB-dependent receptor [Bacteroidales bacterium]|nr:TonB-dependent receptor [Bacteroidales bacterium]